MKQNDIVVCVDKKPLEEDGDYEYMNDLKIGDIYLVNAFYKGSDTEGVGYKAEVIVVSQNININSYRHDVSNFIKIGEL